MAAVKRFARITRAASLECLSFARLQRRTLRAQHEPQLIYKCSHTSFIVCLRKLRRRRKFRATRPRKTGARDTCFAAASAANANCAATRTLPIDLQLPQRQHQFACRPTIMPKRRVAAPKHFAALFPPPPRRLGVFRLFNSAPGQVRAPRVCKRLCPLCRRRRAADQVNGNYWRRRRTRPAAGAAIDVCLIKRTIDNSPRRVAPKGAATWSTPTAAVSIQTLLSLSLSLSQLNNNRRDAAQFPQLKGDVLSRAFRNRLPAAARQTGNGHLYNQIIQI